MSAWVWGSTLAIIYVVLLVTLGVITFRKRRYGLFAIGFLFPILWLIGAALKPR